MARRPPTRSSSLPRWLRELTRPMGTTCLECWERTSQCSEKISHSWVGRPCSATTAGTGPGPRGRRRKNETRRGRKWRSRCRLFPDFPQTSRHPLAGSHPRRFPSKCQKCHSLPSRLASLGLEKIGEKFLLPSSLILVSPNPTARNPHHTLSPSLPPPGYPTTKRPSAGQTRNPFLPPPGYFSKEDQEMFAFLHFSNLMLENKQSVNPFLPPPPRECPQVCDLRAHPDCSCLHPAAFTKDGRGNCNVGSLKPDLQVWCYVDPDKGDPTVVCPDARKSSSKKGYYWSRFACITE